MKLQKIRTKTWTKHAPTIARQAPSPPISADSGGLVIEETWGEKHMSKTRIAVSLMLTSCGKSRGSGGGGGHMHKLAKLYLAVLVALFLASCNGASGSTTSVSSIVPTPTPIVPTPSDVPVTVSILDSQPAGVSVLSFQIEITSASLTSFDATSPTVALLTSQPDIELGHLQAEPVLLGSLNVPGEYTASVTFSNPRMAILNTSGSSITAGGTVCPASTATVESICELTPTLNLASPKAYQSIELDANSPVGLLVHFDLGASPQTDLSITPTIDVTQLLPSAGVIHREHLVGTITGSAAPNFTLQPGLALGSTTPAPAINIATDGNTEYNFKDPNDDGLAAPQCGVNDFSCLAVGQTVRVTANVLSGGGLLALGVGLFEQHDDPALEGTIVSVDAIHDQFQLVMQDGQWTAARQPTTSAAIGVPVTVNVTPATVYEIDLDGATLPTGLQFSGISDLTVGQSVEVQPPGPTAVSITSTGIAFSTMRVRLDETQVTGIVAAPITSTTFVLGSLPPLFNGTSIQVQALSTTQFENVTGVSGLTAGDNVSTEGLLFNTPSHPTLVADKVFEPNWCDSCGFWDY
jgi:hypothetical protein